MRRAFVDESRRLDAWVAERRSQGSWMFSRALKFASPSRAIVASGSQRVASARRLLCAAMSVMAAMPAWSAEPGFAAVTPGHRITLPQDTGAHPAFRTEWWYATGWLTTPDNQPLGFQITFFRSATGHENARPERVRAVAIDHRACRAERSFTRTARTRSTYCATGFRPCICESRQHRRQARHMENVPRRGRSLRCFRRRQRLLAASHAHADTGTVDSGRRRLFAQRAASRTGELLLQRAAIARDRQRRAAGNGRRNVARKHDRDGRRVAGSRVVKHLARQGCRRLGLDRRKPRTTALPSWLSRFAHATVTRCGRTPHFVRATVTSRHSITIRSISRRHAHGARREPMLHIPSR